VRISAEARGKTISRGENDTTPQDYPMIRGDEDSLVWAALTYIPQLMQRLGIRREILGQP
jgi:hypothetical protein